MPEFKAARPGRTYGLQMPKKLRRGSPGAPQNLQVVDIGGIAHFYDPDEGVIVNCEACCQKIDPEDWRDNR